ncbi:hypothetical protein [Butyrivibrio sp. JL13D10]|uniref:hypothetical protein n=1 Tax=Butyrivibrio sp. JL13D10 TaxID=3236815 RepID=UPI0038B50E09
MKNIVFSSILTIFIGVLMLPVSAFAADYSEAMFTESFEQVTNYNKYAANDDSLKGNPIWIQGKAADYDKVSNSIVVKTSEGNWAAFCGDEGTENYKALIQEVIGKDVRVFGKYNGVSTDLKLPRIDFIQSNIYENAYRLETTDNNFRVSYPDYVIDVPELDSETTYGNLTFKDSSKLIKTQDADTLFYYFTTEVPVFMLIHEEKLTGAAYENMSDQEILDNFEQYYNRNSQYIVRKERTQIGDASGIICESSFLDKNMPSNMSLYCFMTVIDRHYYYFGYTQPYLASETVKRFIPSMLENARYENGKKEEEPVLNEEPASSEENISTNEETVVSEESSISGETKTTTEEPVTNEEEAVPQEEEAATADEERKVPSKKEVVGHYTITMEVVFDNGKSKKDTGENVYWGEDYLTDYNEDTGVCILKGDSFEGVITFEYDKDRNVICHGTINGGNNIGSILGKRTSD